MTDEQKIATKEKAKITMQVFRAKLTETEKEFERAGC